MFQHFTNSTTCKNDLITAKYKYESNYFSEKLTVTFSLSSRIFSPILMSGLASTISSNSLTPFRHLQTKWKKTVFYYEQGKIATILTKKMFLSFEHMYIKVNKID